MRDTFGRETVTPAERRRRISRVFASVARRYDLMNDLMSFGIHRLWKRRLIRNLQLSDRAVVIDLAGGTGDVAHLIHKNTGVAPVVADASRQMIEVGRDKHVDGLTWVTAHGEALPFSDNSVDVVTLSFGLRNMTDVDVSLREIARCLKPRGRLLCLEFSTPVFWLKPFYDLYSRYVIPRLGAWVAKEPAAYHYLVDSIQRFPDQRQLCAIFEANGFSGVSFTNLSFGIAAIHTGEKAAEETT